MTEDKPNRWTKEAEWFTYTDRNAKILELCRQGLTRHQIAVEMGITYRVVCHVLNGIYKEQ